MKAWKIIVPHLPPSLNRLYSGVHWAKRKAWADEWHGELVAEIRAAKIPKLNAGATVRILEHSRRPRDCDNAVVAAKFFQDALVIAGRIEDDSPEYVGKVVLESVRDTSDYLEIWVSCDASSQTE